MNKKESKGEVRKCQQCGCTRFKTRSKKEKLYDCRRCEAVYQEQP